MRLRFRGTLFSTASSDEDVLWDPVLSRRWVSGSGLGERPAPLVSSKLKVKAGWVDKCTGELKF